MLSNVYTVIQCYQKRKIRTVVLVRPMYIYIIILVVTQYLQFQTFSYDTIFKL